MEIKELIVQAVSGKTVLEIGGLGDFAEYAKTGLDDWQNTVVQRHARTVTGIDIDRENLARAKERNIAYEYGDVEDASTLPAGPYEVILMIDVIEHLNNVATALLNLKRLLAPGGKLIVSTPSPWAFNNLLRIALRKKPHVFHDHTNYMVKEHFEQLAVRYDLNVSRVTYATMRDTRSARYKFGSSVLAFAGRLNPILNSHIWVELS